MFPSCLRPSKYTFGDPEINFGKYAKYFVTVLVPSSFFGGVLLSCLGNQVTVFEAFCYLTFCFPSIFQCLEEE